MTEGKRGIISAGCIIAIFLAISVLFGGIAMLSLVNDALNETSILESIKYEEGYTYVEDGNSYYIELNQDGVVAKMTQNDLLVAIEMIKRIFIIGAGIMVALAAVYMVIAILLQRSVRQNKKCTGKVVALLVMSLLLGNIFTSILMVVALCIKDTKITYENINSYYIEDKFE